MDLFQNKYRISTARLANWDYGSNGFYFVTICTKDKQPYFGEIHTTSLTEDETQNLASLRATEIGNKAVQYWAEIPTHFPFVELDEFVIMPDHLHSILLINKGKEKSGKPIRLALNRETWPP